MFGAGRRFSLHLVLQEPSGFAGKGWFAILVASRLWDDLDIHSVTIIPSLVLVMTELVIAVNLNLEGGSPSLMFGVRKALHFLALSVSRVAREEPAFWCKVSHGRVVQKHDSHGYVPGLLGGRYVFCSLGVESGQRSFLQQQGAFNFRSFYLSASSTANRLMGHCKFRFSSRVSTCGLCPSRGFQFIWQFLVHNKVLVRFVWLSRLQSK